jgi:BirA family transcriptional regulator, biotin operon repressor / biotin---[acetyl-CoA-carboxylase] ligase
MTSPYKDILHAFAGTAFANIEWVEETGSTNADSAPLLGDERFFGRTLVAEFQTHGAGRKGRSWLAARGSSLLFTTILPGPVATSDLWSVPFWVALAVGNALAGRGITAQVHWPNDLLLRERKLAGILCQSRVAGEIAWVACGVGINVHRWEGADEHIDPPPAFCDDVARIDRPTLLHAVLTEFDNSLAMLGKPPQIAAAWEAAAGLPGARYRILKDGESAPFEARALRLGPDGGLIVQRHDGNAETIALADARALR